MDAYSVAALSPERPFPGLRPFSLADSAYFFGRDKQVYALYRLLDISRFVAVIGSSGSGKSSLVRAGLFPLLDEESREEGGRLWRRMEMRPGDSPLNRLARALSGLGREISTVVDGRIAATRDERIAYHLKSSSQGLVEALTEIDGLNGLSIVLVVDQFEELFRFSTTDAPGNRKEIARARDESTHFVQLLLEASRTPDFDVHVLITMRSDFIGDCARFAGLPEAVSATQFLVPSLSRDQREEVIRKPIEKAGGSIESGLVERLLNDAPDELDQLPVLQHCLLRLWESAGPARQLNADHYKQIGAISGALSQHAGEILQSLVGSEAWVAQIFRALAEIDREGRIIRRSCRFNKLVAETGVPADEARKIVDRFRSDDCSFLTPSLSEVQELADTTRIDVGHEALLRRWEKISGAPDATGEPNDPRPIGWLREEEADGRRYQALLSLARDDRTGQTILSPEQIDWWETDGPTPAWTERYGDGYENVARFIENSRAEQNRRQQEAVSRRRNKFLKIAVPALATLLIISIAGVLTVYDEKKEAEENARRANEQTVYAARLSKTYADQFLNAVNTGLISGTAAKEIFKPVADQLAKNLGTELLPETVELNIQLLMTYSDIQTILGQYDDALKLARQAKSTAEKLAANDEKNETDQFLLFGALFRTADAVTPRGETADNLREGLIDYQRAQIIARKLNEAKPDDGGRLYDLAFIDNKVGETLQLLHKLPEAFVNFNSALDIARKLAGKATANYEWRVYLPITLTKIGNAMFRQSPPDFDGALAQYKEALELQQKLSADFPDNVTILSNQARTQGLVGDVLLRRNKPGDYELAIKAYEEAVAVSENLVARDPASALWIGYLASKYAHLGGALKEHGDIKGALAQYTKELAIRRNLVDKDPDKVMWQNDLRGCQDRISALKKTLSASAPK